MMLAVLGTPPPERARLLDLAHNASEPNWLTVGMPGIPQQLAGAVESERAATAIIQWSPMIMPGLLQVAEYVRSIANTNGLQKHEVESRVMVRLARREILTRHAPTKLDVLVGEVALRQPIGPPDVMAEQLRYLLKASTEKNISVRVVPTHVPWHPGTAGPFVLYEFSDAPPFVHFEHYSSGAFVTNSDDVEAYRSAIAAIQRCAFNTEDSANFIAQVMVEEHGRMSEINWRKSSRSNVNGDCVEVATSLDLIRDSKNPAGPALEADVAKLVQAVKDGRFDR